jgi:hypothetical protein
MRHGTFSNPRETTRIDSDVSCQVETTVILHGRTVPTASCRKSVEFKSFWGFEDDSQPNSAWSHDCAPAGVESDVASEPVWKTERGRGPVWKANVASEPVWKAKMERGSSKKNCHNKQYCGLAGAF